jgi:hypothetical protein
MLVAAPIVLAAQDVQRFFPDRSLLPRLVAAPREPVTAAKLVWAFDTPSRFGSVFEGEADLGASLPLLLLAGTSSEDAVVLGVEGGVFARFNMETVERDLITSDWLFTVPLVIHRGAHWLQARYFHTSAHLGDEYIERFEVERIAYARDALETIAYFSPARGTGFYGGIRWSFRVDPPEHKRWALRAGIEFEPSKAGTFRPYGAGDLEFDQQYGWNRRMNVEVGLRLHMSEDRPTIRIALEYLRGPSPQGQFDGGHTNQLALGVSVDM